MVTLEGKFFMRKFIFLGFLIFLGFRSLLNAHLLILAALREHNWGGIASIMGWFFDPN